MFLNETGTEKKAREKSASVLDYNLFRFKRTITELHAKISGFAVSDRFFQEYELALCEYFEWRDIIIDDDDVSEDLFQGENEISRFLAWYSLYFLTDEYKKTYPELYVGMKRKRLTPLQREILESYGESPLGLYEVQKVVPGRGMYLAELYEGETLFVHNRAAAAEVCTWDILYTGIVGARGINFFSDFGFIIIPPRLKGIVESGILSIYRLPKKSSGEIRRLMRYRSAEVFAFIQNVIEDYENYQVRNSEGDPLLFSTLHYRIKDEEAFLEAVKKAAVFIADFYERSEQGGIGRAEYIWVKKDKKKGPLWENSTQGIVLVEGDRLRAKCNSRFRAEKLKAVLAGVFGKSLEYECTVFEDRKSTRTAPGSPLINEGLLECIEYRDMLKEIVAKHYEKWAEERLPAIGNISPLEAVKSPQGKLRVINLLKELENRNERALRKGVKSAGLMAFPVDRIRRKLKLKE